MYRKFKILIRMILFKLLYRQKNTTKILGKIYIDNKNITLGKKVVLSRNVRFWGDGPIVIEDNVAIGDNVTIFASKGAGVRIGENTLIAADCYIIDMNHGYEYGKSVSECKDTSEKIEIGKNVWLGQDVTVLKGSVIGDGCVVGAKSLVNKKFDKELIIVGNPAKIVKRKEKKYGKK